MRVPLPRRLAARILAAILFVAIGAVLLTVGLLARKAGRYLRDEITARNLQIARLVAARAGLFFDESLNELQALASIFGPLPTQRWISETMFANVSLEFRRFGWISLLRKDGTPVALAGSPATRTPAVDPATVAMVAAGERYVSPVQTDSNYTPFLVVGVPTRLTDGSPGAVFAKLRLREIWQHLEGISLGPHAAVYLVSQEGVLIAHSDKRVLLTPSLRMSIPPPPADPDGDGITLTLSMKDQVQYLASFYRLPQVPGWYAAVVQPVVEAYLPAALLARQALILVAYVSAASIMLGFLLSRQITVPLVELVRGTLQVAAGDLSHRIPVRGRSEIAELAASFNDMTMTLQVRSRDLAASERKYRLVTERANDVIFALDQEGRFTFASVRLESLSGITPCEVLGRTLVEVMAPACPEEWLRMMDAATPADRVECSFQAELATQDGRRVPLEVSITRVVEPGEPPGFSGVARDISERRRLETQLAQAQKMEAIGRLAGGVAHDFNNLLTAILGYCEVVRSRIGENPAAEASLDQISHAGQRAAALTRQLLAFSRQQVLTPRLLDLNKVVEGMAELLRRLIGEQVTLVVRPAPAPARIRADAAQMEQLVMNLAVNARDAMPDGGVLTIAIHNDGERVAVEVADTGTGMSAEVQAHIFEPFFTTKEPGKGTGIGLSTVYGIVQQSDGTITVQSAPGTGSSFSASFPRCQEEPAAVEELPARARDGRSETILVVEDEEALRELMQNILASAGYRVLLASDSASAFAMAERESTRISLLVTDVVLPGLDGKEIAKVLQSRIPALTVLFISGYTADNLADYDRPSENRTFLQKPFTPNTLLSQVRLLLDLAPRRAEGNG
jgi:two-component system cell cycle sensor histidine kinase/response regulator CckA